METKFTAGPWKFEEFGANIVNSGTGSSQLLIARVAINTYRNQGMHNARLIAAAPELLAALVAIVTTWETGLDFSNEIGEARAAIAKATGA